jgi:hypothetical protein
MTSGFDQRPPGYETKSMARAFTRLETKAAGTYAGSGIHRRVLCALCGALVGITPGHGDEADGVCARCVAAELKAIDAVLSGSKDGVTEDEAYDQGLEGEVEWVPGPNGELVKAVCGTCGAPAGPKAGGVAKGAGFVCRRHIGGGPVAGGQR